jgi:ppGpp synthetase/RelA/SpoT-type nucleotidyltranferase
MSIVDNKFSKSEINRAGNILCNDKNYSSEEINNALEVVSYWKSIHNYPLNIFKNRLSRISKKIDGNALSAQRLKRVSSIISKLQRKYYNNLPTMKLTQMQDIAGCRVVLSNLSQVRELYEKYYLKGNLKHTLVNEKNYIQNPKLDGYRSIHLIYKYTSDKGKKEYNDLLVEIQIRSKIQHIWATAVETVDFFTKQAIKSNQGNKNWMYFFKLVSSAFAMIEKSTLIPGVSQNEKGLFLEIKKKEIELDVIKQMTQWFKSLKFFDNFKKNQKMHFFLLELDIITEKLNISAYTKNQEKEAMLAYSKAEKKIYNKQDYDVVLVSADNVKSLKKAYPNYFLDTKEFLKFLNIIIKKY